MESRPEVQTWESRLGHPDCIQTWEIRLWRPDLGVQTWASRLGSPESELEVWSLDLDSGFSVQTWSLEYGLLVWSQHLKSLLEVYTAVQTSILNSLEICSPDLGV